RVGRTICRQCGREVTRETAEVVANRLAALPEGTRLLIGFEMPVVSVDDVDRDDDAADDDEPGGSGDEARALDATLDTLRRRGFTRLLVDGAAVALADVDRAGLLGRATLEVIVDRVRVAPDIVARITDSLEVAYLEGGGAAFAIALGDDGAPDTRHEFSERFECRTCGIPYEMPQPRLFSFNNPFGACPTCHGFGNVMELDLGLVVPDPTKTLAQGAIEPWTRPQYRGYQSQVRRLARDGRVRMDVPWQELTDEERRLLIDGDGAFEGV